ncbi:MAG: glutathione peroxidase [Gammaproteobacteria bacterium]
MRQIFSALILILASISRPLLAEPAACAAALDFHKPLLASQEQVHLCEMFNDKVVLVVNTASKCAYTPQYDGLEKLYYNYKDRGLVVAGFPSNDFGGQEPGSEQQIQTFCRLTYAVNFPMFAKTRVKGAGTDPFYAYLASATGEKPGWNFHKYLLSRDGRVVASFPSNVRPDDPRLVKAIEDLL